MNAIEIEEDRLGLTRNPSIRTASPIASWRRSATSPDDHPSSPHRRMVLRWRTTPTSIYHGKVAEEGDRDHAGNLEESPETTPRQGGFRLCAQPPRGGQGALSVTACTKGGSPGSAPEAAEAPRSGSR